MQENFSEKDTEKILPKVVASFKINGTYSGDNCFPSLNDMLHAATQHPMEYARLKRSMEYVTTNAVRMGLGKMLQGHERDAVFDKRVRFDIEWGEKNKGQVRDYDNVVSCGRKYINDACVKLNVIKDDSPYYLDYGNNTFVYTDKPYIAVSIIEVGEIIKDKKTLVNLPPQEAREGCLK